LNNTAGLKERGAGRRATGKPKYYAITKVGEKALNQETLRWRKVAGLVERLLVEDFQP
jgi:hypothetical protein